MLMALLCIPLASLGQNPRVVTKVIKENIPRNKISITVRYPQISGVAAQAFNSNAEQLVRRQINNFKKGLDPPARYDRTRELSISYKTGFVDSRLISIDFGAGTDTGGAHPNSYSFVLNYDLKSQRQLALNDLFKPNSGHLRTISNYCIQQLRNKLSDYESLRDGAAPTLANYDSWVISGRGLQITFDAYQVASYAEGPQTVLVPWSVLRGLILPNGPVSHLGLR